MPRSFRFTVRRMMAGIGLLAVALSVAIPFGRHSRTSNLARRFDVMVLGLRASCPRTVSQDVWDASVVWTQIIGPTNLYAVEEIPFERRQRLVEALGQRLKKPIGPDLIPWIWDDYAAMTRGTSYERYVRGYRGAATVPLLLDALASRPPGVAPDAWDRAVQETGEAIDTVIMPRSGASPLATAEEQDRFLRSVATILARPASRARLLAVWQALAASGPSGRSYADERLGSIRRGLGAAGGAEK